MSTCRPDSKKQMLVKAKSRKMEKVNILMFLEEQVFEINQEVLDSGANGSAGPETRANQSIKDIVALRLEIV